MTTGPTFSPGEHGLDFSEALLALKAGHRIQRAGWEHSREAFVFLVPGSSFVVNREPLESILGWGARVGYHAHIDMKGDDGTIHVWAPSQRDLMADDWRVI